MTKNMIINNIVSHKNKPFLNYSLKTKTEGFTEKLFFTLFDMDSSLHESISHLETLFNEITSIAYLNREKPCKTVWQQFLSKLPSVLKKLNSDALGIYENDPAANSIEEIYLAYPGFYAIAIYRLSHELYLLNIPLVPRLMSEYAHRLTGTDIHPGASIGTPFFIDHATGTVIGETTIIKDHVKIYQGVTLGALQVNKEMKNTKRHPTVENNVTIYANATILGGNTVIGENSTIGGNAWITNSIPKNSIVSNTIEVKIKQKK